MVSFIRMKTTKKIMVGVFLFYSALSVSAERYCAITYKLNGGRFGDNILSYVRAKWLSFKHNIPLFYEPFQYSEKLNMSQTEETWNATLNEKKYTRTQQISLILNERLSRVLFVSIYNRKNNDLYENMVKYPLFGEEIKNKLQPIEPVPLLTLPSDKITVAVHVRKGGGFDQPLGSLSLYDSSEKIDVTGEERKLYYRKYADYMEPTKFPPDQYYIDQIKQLSTLLNDTRLFVYIFTDDQMPHEIVNRYKQAVGKDNIEFCCRMDENAHDKNVLEDLFSMAQFDCLIRAESNLSWVAQILGNHKIIIFPVRAQWRRDRVIVDCVNIILRDSVKNIFMQYQSFNDIAKEHIVSLWQEESENKLLTLI